MATHVLVLMLSDERRSHKPYALPIRYVPYRSLRDQYIRDLNKDVKRVMQERGLNLVGKHDMYGLLTKCEVKMAGYWPSYFFACLWTKTKSRSINSQTENKANIQPS